MPNLDASIIIPTFNRKGSLLKTLASLNSQSWPRDRFEIIVVDDGSTDDTPEIKQEVFHFTLSYIRQTNQGSAAARNRGAEESKGEILIFLDDDILVEPEYIEGLVEEHRTYAEIVGMGVCYTRSDAVDSPFAKVYSQVFNPKNGAQQSGFVSFSECTTNNLSVERQAFFKIGMMQDVAGDGPTWWGDIDFGYRALQLGFRFRRSGKAICYHHDYSIQNLATFCQRIKKAAQVAVLLFQKYPGLDAQLPMFVDKTPVSIQSDPLPLVIHKMWHALNALPPVLWTMEQAAILLESTAPHPALLRPLYRWIMSSYIYQGYRLGLREYRTLKVHV